MALKAPIELPTNRHSFQNPRPSDVDIHDPQWIPVLSGQHVEKEVSPFHDSTFPPFTLPRPSQSHSYSRSSLAPESIAAASGTQTPSSEQVPDVPALPPLPPSPTKFELPAGRPTSSYFQQKSISSSPRDDTKDESTDTEATVESTADRSTVGTASLLDEQTYSIPGQPLSAKVDEQLFSIPGQPLSANHDVTILPPLPLSSHSSFSSLRKAAVPMVPTSKYSRKPVAGHNSTLLASPQIPSASPVPQEQPLRVSSIFPLQQEQPQSRQPMPSPNMHSSKQSGGLPKSPLSTNLQSSKSSASQKRQRALNSHPSNSSLVSRHNSSSSDVDVPAVPGPAPQSRSRPPSHKARKSTDSRINRNPSFTSLAPTPAPTTPLPQLPPHALTSDSESNAMPKLPPEAYISVERGPRLRADHSQMASFMTTTQTMIFRRFDDVHVQLLLCLQDEISDLESKMKELDNAGRTVERMQVIRELRKVVGEYGMF